MRDANFEYRSVHGSILRGEIQGDESLFDALRRIGAPLPDSPCGGAGSCGKCRVRLVSGDAGEPSPEELRSLTPADLASGIRLSCRLKSGAALVVEQTESGTAARIRESFRPIEGIARPTFTAPGELGVAVDIGTTTIAAYLVSFAPGEGGPARVIASASRLNSQRCYGADVIARIDYTMRVVGGLAELARLVRSDVASLIGGLLASTDSTSRGLRAISVVGNTTMLHLFAAVDPAGIATAPFVPAFTEARIGDAEEFGLPYPSVSLTMAPSVAAYVGADIVAAIRAAGLEGRDRPALLLDLGTNGEMALGDREGISCCATAAGPAFEGAAISCGLGGVEGAVDSLEWAGGRLRWTTIADCEPIGICGSGIIDAAACLVRAGLVDSTGAMDNAWREGGYELVRGTPLLFTQADVRQIQLAKAAVAAGIGSLLEARGIRAEDVERVYLAGGFGSYLRAESAAIIGLIPPVLLPKVEVIGNAAGHGAVRMLLFADELDRMRALAESCHYLELSASASFNDRFMEELLFPESDAVLPAVTPASSHE